MKNFYTWAAKPARRTLTVGDLKAAKGKRKFTQVTACLLYTSPSPRD